MAQRTNTIEYAFATRTTSLSSATRHDFTAITLDIAESSSRTFRSVYVEVYDRGNETSATSMTSWLIGVKIDAVAFNDVTVTSTIANSGDQQSHVFRRDVTSYFATNYTGTSHSIQVGVQFGALATINVAAKLVVTYEFDDASQTTRTKTVRIPVESGTTTLTSSLAEIGTNQVPQLTGSGSPFLPESSIAIKDMFFEVFANEGHVSGTTDDQLGLELDSEGETLFGSLEQALDSSPWMLVIWKRTDMSTTAAHAFRARGTTTGRLPQLAAILVVTYTYDHSASSTLLNSLMFALPSEEGAMGGTSSGNQSKVSFKFFVEEPTTITLKQSAVVLSFSSLSTTITGLNVAVGSQTHRAYTPSTALNSPAGQYTLVHRFDSGGAAGSGISLARGENELLLAWYRTSSASSSVGAGVTWRAILNYTSGKASGGSGAHNHTTLWLAGATAAIGTTAVFDHSAFAPNIPESSYWTTAIGYDHQIMHAGKGHVVVAAERQSGEGVADGWQDVHTVGMNPNNELSIYTTWLDATGLYDRHQPDPDTKRLAVETSRVHRISSFIDPATVHAGWSALVTMLTYHAITISCTRASSGHAGDGSGIGVRVYRDDTHEQLYSATTVTGGNYTFMVYDNTISLFAEAEEDGTHTARSRSFTAS